jgi:hypothetical protein
MHLTRLEERTRILFSTDVPPSSYALIVSESLWCLLPPIRSFFEPLLRKAARGIGRERSWVGSIKGAVECGLSSQGAKAQEAGIRDYNIIRSGRCLLTMPYPHMLSKTPVHPVYQHLQGLRCQD